VPRRNHISTKVALEAEDMKDIARRHPGAAWRRASCACGCREVGLLQLHNHIGGGVGGRRIVSVDDVLGRSGIADTAFDRSRRMG
jgi:hypothetical protein